MRLAPSTKAISRQIAARVFPAVHPGVPGDSNADSSRWGSVGYPRLTAGTTFRMQATPGENKHAS